ncbi:arsenosugar biosynthesis radical SAM (seleno)protein ArsS [Sinimarinibacterium thermocellulolyticum]|uniref:Arsenosugar biosynthesis radical SAM (Seleno)protein ArsS n=1 Tax=Sinimarinibacterium thermocellulolyticum TaxID=3170016 RepID=A0ABV2A5N2_9GAMM
MSDRFSTELERRGIALPPRRIDTLQLNITRRCNQACRHCHVDASPARTEMLSAEGIAACLDVLERHPQIGTLDLTGGAPELHPQFVTLVERARALGRRVIVRHNLTVQFDGDPATKQPMDHLPAFFARQRVEVVSSLPYYQPYFTDAQRGSGVFAKSIEALKRLNAVGYGIPGSGLVLNLVYNPVGPYLPAPQASLEADYRKALAQQFGVYFNALFTITNMPIHRFRLHLEKSGQYAAYMDKLLAAFNPAAAENVMCRDLISVDHQGRLYDCDFNQQLGLYLQREDGSAETIFDFDAERLLRRRIRLGDHCLGCSAGAGSSCGGATA